MRLFFLFLCIIFTNYNFSQNRFNKKDLIERSTAIIPNSSVDFSDLEFLKSKIDTTLPIFLGESSHTIGDYNHLRVRMIKYLHEKLNYNVIVFEAPFSNLQYINENRGVLTAEKMVRMGLYSIWKTDDLVELMNYLKTHPKLKIVGVDCQDYYVDSLSINSYYLKIEKQNSELAKDYKQVTTEYRQLMKLFRDSNIIESEQLIILINKLQKTLKNNNLNDFELQFQLSNFKNNCSQFQISQSDFSKSNQFRDSTMAENYLTLTKNLFPNEKVIVWGHNAHLSKKSLDAIYPKSMGEFLNEKIKFNAIGLYAYGGNYEFSYTKETKTIKKPSKKYLEYYLHQNDLELSYIDLKNISLDSWLNKTYKTLNTGHGTKHIAPSLFFDAIIFFQHVEKSKYLY